MTIIANNGYWKEWKSQLQEELILVEIQLALLNSLTNLHALRTQAMKSSPNLVSLTSDLMLYSVTIG